MASRADNPTGSEVAEPTRCRVMVVDDSVVARTIVQRLVNADERFEVVAQASSAGEALARLEDIAVDIILLDIEMPGMDGLAAIPELLSRSGNAAIIVLSAHCTEDAQTSVRAMALGASETLFKPDARIFANEFAWTLREAMQRIANGLNPAKEGNRAQRSTAPLPTGRNLARPVRCLGVGASTGGVHALTSFLAALPPELAMPILVTQHLPTEFVPFFASQLRQWCGRDVTVARDGQLVEQKTALIAPGDAHLSVVRAEGGVRVQFRRRPAASGCCPSVDPMLSSMAEVYGRDAVGVVLSGMGRDGALGAAELAACGGELLVQDIESAVIWGMPGAIARAGDAHLAAPPTDLAAYVAGRARTFGWS